MRESDFAEFGAMLDAVCGLLSRGAYTPSAQNTALWFRALGAYDLATVREGFDAHVRDPKAGKFVPAPADVIAQIVNKASADGRPGPEEAWAMAVQASDERRTVVWTDEIAEAWGITLPVLKTGDEVAARMTFREAYNRLLTEARQAGVKPRWTPTLGTDPEQRDVALEKAHNAGLLPKPEPLRELPAPDHAMSHLNASVPPHIRERLQSVRDKLTGKAPADPPAKPLNASITIVQPDHLPPGMKSEISQGSES